MSESEPAPSFSPGEGIRGVSQAPKFFDAADILHNSKASIQSAKSPGILLLADGTRYEGLLFGAEKISEGELVFTTGMCGYQESLTDPSFAGQVLTFTYPLIGNYGIIPGISESSKVHPRGVICRQQITYPACSHPDLHAFRREAPSKGEARGRGPLGDCLDVGRRKNTLVQY